MFPLEVRYLVTKPSILPPYVGFADVLVVKKSLLIVPPVISG